MKLNRPKKATLFALVAAGVMVLAGVSSCDTTNAPAQNANQNLSNDIENAARAAVPYPLSQMRQGGWTEEREVNEHLLRQNDPNAVRWITLLTQNGQVIATYTIRGMVFDPNSSMTETQDLDCTYNSSASSCGTVASPGDNGTYGPEAGCAAFYTSSNAEVQVPCGMWWVESDVPQNLTTQPLITYNVNQAPSVNHGGLVNIGGGH